MVIVPAGITEMKRSIIDSQIKSAYNGYREHSGLWVSITKVPGLGKLLYLASFCNNNHVKGLVALKKNSKQN